MSIAKGKAPADKSKKDIILDVASELFANKGFFAVSVRTIARRVGVKESSLYHHFENKEDILENIFDRFKSMLHNYFQTTLLSVKTDGIFDTLNPADFLWRELKRYIDYWNDPSREKLWYVASIEKYRNPRATEMILQHSEEFMNLYETYFRLWIEKKVFNPFEPRMLAEDYVYSILAMHSEYRLLRTAGKPTRTIVRKMHAFILFFLGRIQS